MKKAICLITTIVLLLTSVEAGAVGIIWSESSLVEGRVSATVTGIEEGDRVALATYSDGVFSDFSMVWSEGESAQVGIDVKNTDDTARAFVWNQSGMIPKVSDSYLSKDGILDGGVIFSDNQKINNASAIGYRTINALVGDYSISFDMTVKTIGDNAIMLGDSANGTLGYGEASAILQFTSDTFTTRSGDGAGGYTGNAVELCKIELNKIYHVTIQGNTTTNTYNVIINDGTDEYISDTMHARKDAIAGIDTIAFVNNSKNAVVKDGYCSNYNFFGTNLQLANEKTVEIPHYTYEGFEGMYYGMEVVSTGKYVRGNSGRLTADYSMVSDASAMFIPRDMGDGSHAFVCKSSNNRMTTNGVSGSNLTSSAYAMTDNTQHWVMEESENYSENNKTYYLQHIESGNYVGLSGTSLALVTGANKKEIRFVPLENESLLYRVAKTDAYNLLTGAQKERLESVYESVAGDVFGRYGGNSEWTPRIRMDNLFTEILSGKLSEAEQLTKLQEFLEKGKNGYIYDGQASHQVISTSIPGTSGVYCETDAGVAGNYDFWRGTMLNGMLYKLRIYDASGKLEQTIDLYVQDDGIAQTNANTFKNIIVQIPYIYRQHLTTVKSRSDSANSYNGGGGVIYIRLNWSPDANGMRSTITHELGHVNDQACGTWSSGSGWNNAIAADMYAPSVYGATNSTEDFAEFCRIYFSCYGNPDMQRGLQVIMPERYASFGRMRKNNFNGWGLWEDEYTS